MHRDTRLSELVGDLVISREDTANGEIIRQNIIKGGILTSEICLLDDISRAPGESLNVLLRILNERKYGDEEIPLLTAIATSNPTADEYYNEPLDPANLDRFVIQINSNGLSYSKEWEDVKKIVSRQLFYGLAHEIKNPLTPIQLTIDRLKSKYSTQLSEKDKDKLIFA